MLSEDPGRTTRFGPLMISQTTRSVSKIKTPFDSPVSVPSKNGAKIDLDVTDDVRDQIKVGKFDFSGLVTLASKIWMLSAKQSQWIDMDSVSDICKYHFLCSVTIIQVKVISGHQVKMFNQKASGYRLAIHRFRSDFRKDHENWP